MGVSMRRTDGCAPVPWRQQGRSSSLVGYVDSDDRLQRAPTAPTVGAFAMSGGLFGSVP